MIRTEENVHGRSMPTMMTLELQLPAHYNKILSTLSGVSSVDTLASNYQINHSGCSPPPKVHTAPHRQWPTNCTYYSFFFSEKISCIYSSRGEDPALNICTSDSMAHENSLSWQYFATSWHCYFSAEMFTSWIVATSLYQKEVISLGKMIGHRTFLSRFQYFFKS